jgi:hypothetical protein
MREANAVYDIVREEIIQFQHQFYVKDKRNRHPIPIAFVIHDNRLAYQVDTNTNAYPNYDKRYGGSVYLELGNDRNCKYEVNAIDKHYEKLLLFCVLYDELYLRPESGPDTPKKLGYGRYVLDIRSYQSEVSGIMDVLYGHKVRDQLAACACECYLTCEKGCSKCTIGYYAKNEHNELVLEVDNVLHVLRSKDGMHGLTIDDVWHTADMADDLGAFLIYCLNLRDEMCNTYDQEYRSEIQASIDETRHLVDNPLWEEDNN